MNVFLFPIQGEDFFDVKLVKAIGSPQDHQTADSSSDGLDRVEYSHTFESATKSCVPEEREDLRM